MKIIDGKGRLFGKLNILDLGAIAVILLVIIGIFIVPGATGSLAQVTGGNSSSEKVQVSLIVRGLNTRNSDETIAELNDNTEVNVIVRNEPAGKLLIESAQELPNYVAATQPDGSVIAQLDPRPIVKNSVDMILTMTGNGQTTNDGYVIANQKVKIGTVLELDNPRYNFRGTVIDVISAP
ncbi:DUF4330 domain-containing protein [Cyanobacterium stanieri LEGE 03274]|uniref:DUF4330 domain-containing protein n=1 Tax=Cyanobacterium stanieri LEGE 03274 TaxID=1828756 RepID=A0ABR9V5S0_9CHRO|nr:DUF4330 domain-containing protein [Cyanobacterium stanieri]MBE9222184.1 DUF4330 domain-containing protein [Cyanobacterium stanieri LEGE 03274]